MKSDLIKKLAIKDKYLQRKYGITLKQRERMAIRQRYSCAICHKHESNFKRGLAVDHNHKTGKVRGLLCYYCNKFRVGRATLESAKAVYEYLMRTDT